MYTKKSTALPKNLKYTNGRVCKQVQIEIKMWPEEQSRIAYPSGSGDGLTPRPAKNKGTQQSWNESNLMHLLGGEIS